MFWDRFYHLCEINNKKPTPVGKEMGVSSGIISTWKKEGYFPSGEMLIKVANYFDCSIDYLVGRSDLIKVQNSEFSSDEMLLLEQLRTLPEDSQSEIMYLVNYKYEQQQKKRGNYTESSPLTEVQNNNIAG